MIWRHSQILCNSSSSEVVCDPHLTPEAGWASLVALKDRVRWRWLNNVYSYHIYPMSFHNRIWKRAVSTSVLGHSMAFELPCQEPLSGVRVERVMSEDPQPTSKDTSLGTLASASIWRLPLRHPEGELPGHSQATHNIAEDIITIGDWRVNLVLTIEAWRLELNTHSPHKKKPVVERCLQSQWLWSRERKVPGALRSENLAKKKPRWQWEILP